MPRRKRSSKTLDSQVGSSPVKKPKTTQNEVIVSKSLAERPDKLQRNSSLFLEKPTLHTTKPSTENRQSLTTHKDMGNLKRTSTLCGFTNMKEDAEEIKQSYGSIMSLRKRTHDRCECQESDPPEKKLQSSPKKSFDNERLPQESVKFQRQPTYCTVQAPTTSTAEATDVQSPHCGTQLSSCANEGDLDELAVRSSFVFTKENLIFESVYDKLVENGLFHDRDKDYVCKIPGKRFISERLIKLMIRNKVCKDFVKVISKMPCHQHVYEKIQKNRKRTNEADKQDNAYAVNERLNITSEFLQKHFAFFYKELEPHFIADKMFQEGHIFVSEHDYVTEFNTKYKRIKALFKILRQKPELSFHISKYITVLGTLEQRGELTDEHFEYALCMQQSFILLQEELSGTEVGIPLMEHVYRFLDEINLSDIENQISVRRQKCKLLKILMMKGEVPCREIFRVFEEDMEREDLIREMRTKSNYLKERGKPILENGLTQLNISCLQVHEGVLRDELDPLYVCDRLFEERAVGFPDHDKVTESRRRQKQMDCLLNTLRENKNDCFHFFLSILQKEGYSSVLNELGRSATGTKLNDSNEICLSKISHNIMKVPGACDVQNGPIEMRLSVADVPTVEQALRNHFHSKETRILEEVITHAHINIDNVTSGSVVLQLRPVTDQAAQSLLNARDNNNLLEMIIRMLKQINAYKYMDDTESLEIKVQVLNASPINLKTKSYATKAEVIKQQIKAYRNKLLSELEPEELFAALSNSKVFPQEVIEKMKSTISCRKRIENMLAFVEKGDSSVAEKFFTALKDVGYCDIVQLIDPTQLHEKAEIIRKKIASNYKSILDEMQISLAKETLSNCIGDVASVKESILPKNGKHRHRMHQFLLFILQEDHNVIQFENMLKNNDLEDLLKIDEKVQEEFGVIQGIEVKTVENPSSEGVLFESVITLSFLQSKQMDEFLETERKQMNDLLETQSKQMDEFLETWRKQRDELLKAQSKQMEEFLETERKQRDELLKPQRKQWDKLLEAQEPFPDPFETPPYLLSFPNPFVDSQKDPGLGSERDMDFSLEQKTISIKPHMSGITHISILTPDAIWVSDGWSLKQVDATGNVIKTLDDKYKYDSFGGAHAVSGDGELVFLAWDLDSILDKSSGRRCCVFKMKLNGHITNIFTTDLYPQCLHSSYINGDILIGIRENPYWGGKALVLRIGKTGRKIQDIELKKSGQRLYDRPIYITENRLNGDIMVSDDRKRALVVVDSSGRHRFDYTGRPTELEFQPMAVCTDLQGRILLAHRSRFDISRNDYVYCISHLDQNGKFLTTLLTEPHNAFNDCQALCVDDKNKIYVSSGSEIKVFRFSSDYNVGANSPNKILHHSTNENAEKAIDFPHPHLRFLPITTDPLYDVGTFPPKKLRPEREKNPNLGYIKFQI